MKKHLHVRTLWFWFLSFVCVSSILFSQSCQKQNYEEEKGLDQALLTSPELAEYIVAGADYHHALDIFMVEIGKIKFEELEFEEQPNGMRIAHLPLSVCIEEKIQNLNEKKRELFAKYPQFALLSEQEKNCYFRMCIKNSEYVNGRLLELDIDVNRPMTKGASDERIISTGAVDNVLEFFGNWADNNYNEIVVLSFSDGTSMYYYTSDNTNNSCFTPEMKCENNKYYYGNKQVTAIIHSQPNSSTPSSADLDARLPGISYSIYYGGALHDYTNMGN